MQKKGLHYASGVCEMDLGLKTESAAARIQQFDSDASWRLSAQTD